MRMATAILLLSLLSAAAIASNAPLLHAQGVRQFQLSDDEGALKSLDAALAQDPAFAPSRELRAMVYMARQDRSAAIIDYTTLIASSPEPKYLFLRGSCRAAAGDLLGGLADAEAALAIDPAFDPAANLRENLHNALAR